MMITSIAFLLGLVATLLLDTLPQLSICLIVLALLGTITWLKPQPMLVFLLVCALGFTWVVVQGNRQLGRRLPLALDGKTLEITGTIASIPDKENEKVHFLFDVQSLPSPLTVRLTWKHPKQVLKVGTQMTLVAKLKRPRYYANPGSFDVEKLFFQQKIGALGFVVNAQPNCKHSKSLFRYPINSLREYLSDSITKTVEGREFLGPILALALGIKTGMTDKQWDVLRKTGTSHLMAISGLHVGLVAALGYRVSCYLWRFAPSTWLRFLSSPIMGAWCAWGVAVLYALLSGFSVSTQRALIMVSGVLMSLILKRYVTLGQCFFASLFITLVWDPFSILNPGFWLSFLAVGYLAYALKPRVEMNVSKFWGWLGPQLIIAVGLVPVSAFFFGEASVISPVANSIAIPLVSVLVVPCILIGTSMLLIYQPIGNQLLVLADVLLSKLWWVLNELNGLSWASIELVRPSIIGVISGALGFIWLFSPKGIPGKFLGIFCFFPVFFPSSKSLAVGLAYLNVLDVGQGLSIIVQTRHHTLIYDTGARLSEKFNMGDQVVNPYLKHQQIKKIDKLMISHPDNDHIGGAEAILAERPVAEILTSDTRFLQAYRPKLCESGQSWIWDEVSFEVLHPYRGLKTKKRNDRSCVLKITAKNQSVLLTGDIELISEKKLIQLNESKLNSTVLVVPHHGSATSSSKEFIQAVNPKFALVSAGHLNRYGHPKAKIIERYKKKGVSVLSTDLLGGLSTILGISEECIISSFRMTQKKIWH